MWHRIHNWFFGNPARTAAHEAEASVEATRLCDLHVAPEVDEDFDADSCKQLLDTLIQEGAETVDDVLRLFDRDQFLQQAAGSERKLGTCSIFPVLKYHGTRCEHRNSL